MKNWTTDQLEAIFSKWCDEKKTKSSNILVNAAAGSGKTAVLVERIINKLSADISSPDFASIDEILVVTFTNAAAKEMKQRISDALNKKQADALAENNYKISEHLKKQLDMLDTSDITTIDSFCLKIVRNYFHLIDIDPNFKIADNAECELIKDEVIEELFDCEYKNDSFIKLLFMLTDGRDTKELSELIRNLFNFTRSLPKPSEWLHEKAELLKIENENNIWFDIVKKEINQKISYAKNELKNALSEMISYALFDNSNNIDLILKNNPPEEENELYFCFGTYYTAIYNEYIFLDFIENKKWDEMYNSLKKLEFINLRTAPKFKDKNKIVTDKEFLARLKSARDNAKESVLSVQPLINAPVDEVINISNNSIYPMISTVVDLCEKFDKMYSAKKSSKNILEFYDIEHLCLKVISENDDVKNQLRTKYTEILIDEYQDTNALQEEIFISISRGDNMYMVGDMKQSIYRFRSSDPTIFKNKNSLFRKEKNSENRKIVLGKNFRSRKEVLACVNSVFKAIMTEEAGEIDYDTDQQLNLGNTEYLDKNTNYKSECYVILSKGDNDDVEEELTKTQTEARFIAKKIKELKDSGFLVHDRLTVKKKNENSEDFEEQITHYRPLENRDIAIITSSHKNISSIYQKELAKLGIDCFASIGGYFEKKEIVMALALLKLINNPLNDIPLISVMRMPIFGFSDDDLCEIKLCGGECFYNSLQIACEYADEPLRSKCSEFYKKLNKWREYKKIMPCDRLIWTLFEETDIYSFCESLYGEDAVANLKLLFVRARAFEESGYKGLFNFIRYIGKMQKREEDLAGAIALGENSDVVKLMTIHKSKGLEFPVVFLAGCSKIFNSSDTKRKVLYHKDFGFGTDYIDYENNFFYKTLQKNAITLKLNIEILSEEMRKLYVAMTRAKEKLIVTSVCKKKNTEEFSEELPVEYEKWSLVDACDPIYVANSNRFIDWIAPVAMKDSDNWLFNIIPYTEAQKINLEFNEDAIEDNKNTSAEIVISENDYKFENSTKIPTKLSVTQVKNLNSEVNSELIKKPEFIAEDKAISGADRGTAIHYVMQKFIPNNNFTKEDVEKFIAQLVLNEELTEREAISVNPSMICDFYSSDLGKRILMSDRVYRESTFEIEIPINEITESAATEKIILQGIIDCYFYEGNDIVLVDYKTDFYTDIEAIKEKYRQQVQLYKLAIEKITKKCVKNQFIYLFSSKTVIEYL